MDVPAGHDSVCELRDRHHAFVQAGPFLWKGAGFGWGLLLLAPVFYMILAFGDAEYVGPGN